MPLGHFQPTDYKHDLYILSNVLTTQQFAETASDQILKIFYWLGPGHQVLIMGSSARAYDEIYALVGRLASQAKVDRVDDWDELFTCRYNDLSAERVKSHYNDVVRHMLKLHSRLRFPLEVE